MDTENGGKKREMEEKIIRLEIAKNIFKEVLDANLHQSEIAARLLILVTFIAGGTIALFALFLESDISALWMGIDLIPGLFLAHISFVLIAIIFVVENIGPSFQTEELEPNKESEKPRSEEAETPKSILFFKFILEEDMNKWISTFHKKESEEKPKEYLETIELQEKFIHDCIMESHLLAKKTHGKVKRNLVAHLLFYSSFYFLFLLACSGIANYFNAWNSETKALIFITSTPFLYIMFRVAKRLKKEAGNHLIFRILEKLDTFYGIRRYNQK